MPWRPLSVEHSPWVESCSAASELIGPSRKSFLSTLAGMESVGERLEGTLAAVTIGVMNGASLVRVHDVRQCRKACLVADAVRNS